MPQDPDAQLWQEIDALLYAGQKIQAIKLYREATGQGLKEAKDAVEARERQLRETRPDYFAPARKGCLGVVLLLAAGAVPLIILILT